MKAKINKNIILSIIFIASLAILGFYFNNFIKHPEEVMAATYTADLCVSGTASADSEYPGLPASYAFDNAYAGNASYWQTANVAFPHWLKYDFGSGNEKIVNRYTLRSWDYNSRIYDINNWVFEGSNDNSNWVSLDTRSGITWVQAELKTFNFINFTAYRYYRIYIYSNQEPNNYGLIQEMEMMGYADGSVADCGSVSGLKCSRIMDGSYTVDMFTLTGNTTTSTNWTVPTGVSSVEYLVVAGGGGGGEYYGGGGGGGGFLTGTLTELSGSQTVTVGAGGAGGEITCAGSSGANSVFASIVAIGGGGGGGSSDKNGKTGGSGGGAVASGTGGSGTSNQGYAGGNGHSWSSPYSAGGGGGSGGIGSPGGESASGNGGQGTSSFITGSEIYYSGGGGGASNDQLSFLMPPGNGGTGGGGTGGRWSGYGHTSLPGAPNSGGGGGGRADAIAANTTGNGGSGIVIIRYNTSSSDCLSTSTVTCTQTTDGNFKINKYTLVSETETGIAEWIPPTGTSSVDYLVVAGGGGGGMNAGGGGGGGGFVEQTGKTVVPGTLYSITVGTGGAGATSQSTRGSSGSNSVFDLSIAVGGGGGGSWLNQTGINGGSGGGSSSNASAGSATQGNSGGGTGYGFNGGVGSLNYNGGGGGGAGALGQTAPATGTGGAGGAGRQSSILGITYYYAGGGGAGGHSSGTGIAGAGGAGGGGGGSNGQYVPMTGGAGGTGGISNGGAGVAYGAAGDGGPSTGGGGGGNAGSVAPYFGGRGGSGIVIIRYAVPTIATVYPIYGPTNDTTPNYTFNSTTSGTITYGGSCSSSTTAAVAGNNTITLNALSAGAYSNCTIQVSGSNTLTIPTFIIGEDCGSTSLVECSRGLLNGYYIDRYTYLSGNGTATWTVPTAVSSVEYLVIGGGGGGGGSNSGGAAGGGAGGFLTASGLSVSETVSITIGSGGAGGAAGSATAGNGSNGNNSILVSGATTITAYGGGGGGGNPIMNGGTGGSGGGAYYNGAKGESYNNDAQGHDGGIGSTVYWATAGGGGGAGSAGSPGGELIGGNGGNGSTSSLSGASLAYAAGGGGSVQTNSLTAGTGGSVIGGNGNNNGAGYNAFANTGSGGGGAGGGSYVGGTGSSGVVIIKYLASQNHNYYCSYYYDDEDVLQVGKDGFLDLKFTYQDPDSSARLSGYRIAIDASELALANIDSQADVIVPDTSTWVSGGSAVPGAQITNSQVSVQKTPNASLEQIGYGTGTTKQLYYWWVKVRNSNGLESDWIPGPAFYTPKRHYPIPRPIAISSSIQLNANIQFCAGTDLTNQDDPEERDACYSACWTGTPGSAVVGESETNWKCSVCYDSTNSPVSCTDPDLLAEGNTNFTWYGPAGYVLNTDYSYESSTTSASANPVIKFIKEGSSLNLGLNITGSDCGGQTGEMLIGVPMPKWKEVSPF